jgi:Na+-transporting methylmalonyl-CoA/oxaloacetate decarboxylase gamma subunit
MLDWGLALGIAGGGAAVVFITLMTLAATVWIIGLIVRRAASKNKKTVSESVENSAQAKVEQRQRQNHAETISKR